jgi:hypothetical protein
MKYIRFICPCKIVLAFSMLAFSGCDEPSAPPPKLGVQNWKPTAVGGPMEVRPLPPATHLLEDFRRWANENSDHIARVYETTLIGASNQLNFKVEVSRGETPVGRPEHTYVSFIYSNPTNGIYQFLWDRLGRHSADFMRIGKYPKRVLVTFNWRASAQSSTPILEIVGFEGMEAEGVLIASPGGDLK